MDSAPKKTFPWQWVAIALLLVIIVVLVFQYCVLLKSNRGVVVDEEENKEPVSTVTAELDNKLDDVLYYENEGQIYAFDLGSGQTRKIVDGSRPALSSDKTKLAYDRLPNSLEDEVYYYDLTTNSEVLFVKFSEKDFRYGAAIESWSPDGKHVIIDSGTSPGRSKSIHSFPGAIEKAGFPAHGFPSWIDNDTVVFTEGDFHLARETDASGSGVSVVNTDGKLTRLKTPTLLTDYGVLRAEGETIYFQKSSVKTFSDWGKRKIEETYWSISRDGQNEQQVNEDQARGDLDSLNNKVKSLLPSQYRDNEFYYVSGVVKTSKSNTVIFELCDGRPGQYNYYIAKINLDKPESFEILFPGTRPILVAK